MEPLINPNQCQRQKRLFSVFWQLWCLPLCQVVFIKPWQQIRPHAILGCHVGVIALSELRTNKRTLIGVVLIGVGVILYNAHLLFIVDCSAHPVPSPLGVVPDPCQLDWFYHHWFFWLFTNREEFLGSFLLTGFFLISPTKWGYRYLFTPFVACLVSEVIFQSIQIDHWTHFYIPLWSIDRGWQILSVTLVSVFAIYKAANYAVYRYTHLKAGNLARINGVVIMPRTPVEVKYPLLEQLFEEHENYNARV